MPAEMEEEAAEAGAGVEVEVEVKDIEAPEVELAADYLRRMLELADIDAEVSVRPPETPGDGLGRASAVLDIDGEDLGLLIGRRGSTLAAVQYMVNLMVSRKTEGRVLVSVDAEHYRRRREESLLGLAHGMADRVRQSGRPVTLEPMPAAERRIIHLALTDDPDVATDSVGSGDSRRVVIEPR
jgi:spoIIIJ-associated protein